jgi:hypothetical protein
VDAFVSITNDNENNQNNVAAVNTKDGSSISWWCDRCNKMHIDDPNSDQSSCPEWKV